ncbi:universal stress protein [Actinospongicola halichondriae]|uniref:universal stress protein n=1 Tax=Actinospongicola halichondriae TaxID=3236844 RepID=UPI003D4E5100
MTVIVVVILAWLLLGALLGLYEARRGHWRWLWLLGAIGGPLAIPLARQIEQNEQGASPLSMSEASGRGPGGIRLLVGVDGSAESIEAARRATDILGSRLGACTIAFVTDFETLEAVPGPVDADHPDLQAERAILQTATFELERWLGFAPAAVLLAGAPAEALKRHAGTGDFDLIAIGSRGKGLSKALLGSCASRLVSGAPVATLILPANDPTATS